MKKFKRNQKNESKFSKIIISLASPEDVLEQSHGDVTKPETINYRTFKPGKKEMDCSRKNFWSY